jgi:isoleucyl-tRNA synthetase
LAPIVPHTAEELWEYRPATPDKPSSIHLAEFPEADSRWDDGPRDARWDELLALRERVLVALEGLRKSKQIGSASEAKVKIATNRPEHWQPVALQLATLCIVSEVEIVADPAASVESITAQRAPFAKCQRCWNYRSTVGRSAVAPALCERCVGVIEAENARPRN